MAEKGLIEKSTMEGFANWIREQNGTSAKMLPSEMLAALETIGGLPASLKSVDSGTVTVASTTANYNISHKLGEVPDFYVVMCTDPQPCTEYQVSYAHFFIKMSHNSYGGSTSKLNVTYNALKLWYTRQDLQSYTTVRSANSDYSNYATSTQLKLTQYNQSNIIGNALGAGYTYTWICGKFA